jgi:hypothetical protein
MAKKTEGEITLKLRVSAKGHQTAEGFKSLIKGSYGNFFVHSTTIIEDNLQRSVIKAKVDQAARDLNTLRKILKQALPDGEPYHYMEGCKGSVKMAVWMDPNPIKKKDMYGKTCIGEFYIEDEYMKVDQYSNKESLSIADPKFMENLEALIIRRYRTQRQKNGA